METYIEERELVDNPLYEVQRQKSLSSLTDDMIDDPIVNLINGFNRIPYCFTMQCCYGHFVYSGHSNPKNLDPLPNTNTIKRVEYRIAYVAFCIENSHSGKGLMDALRGMTDIDPWNVQFCCAEWFWNKQVNSYALQVEPDRFKKKDKAILDYKEALIVEKIRNKFFIQLNQLLLSQYDHI